MEISNIIYIIVAILFVMRIVNRNKQAADENKPEEKKQSLFESMRPEAVSANQKTTTVQINQNKRVKQGKGKRAKNQNAMPNKTSNHTFASLAAAESPDEPRTGESMTDYLSRKAHEDDVERKKEEWEERREEQKSIGNLRLAKRLPFGERPPRGSILKKCPYCGAENLVSHMSHEKYHCYFCRSSLK